MEFVINRSPPAPVIATGLGRTFVINSTEIREENGAQLGRVEVCNQCTPSTLAKSNFTRSTLAPPNVIPANAEIQPHVTPVRAEIQPIVIPAKAGIQHSVNYVLRQQGVVTAIFTRGPGSPCEFWFTYDDRTMRVQPWNHFVCDEIHARTVLPWFPPGQCHYFVDDTVDPVSALFLFQMLENMDDETRTGNDQ
jgi:hypothetical protein